MDKAYVVKGPDGSYKVQRLRDTEEQAWSIAELATRKAQDTLERDGYRCIPVTLREIPPDQNSAKSYWVIEKDTPVAYVYRDSNYCKILWTYDITEALKFNGEKAARLFANLAIENEPNIRICEHMDVLVAPAAPKDGEDELLRLIADDSYAATFQSMGQYRTALLKAYRGVK